MGRRQAVRDQRAETACRGRGDGPRFTRVGPAVERGLVRVTSVTLLEVGFSARSAGDLRHALGSAPLRSMPVEYFTPAIEDRAIEVQAILAERGQHRAPSIPDLLIAAVAELAQLTVLHVDKDFELIAEVTGQPVERLSQP